MPVAVGAGSAPNEQVRGYLHVGQVPVGRTVLIQIDGTVVGVGTVTQILELDNEYIIALPRSAWRDGIDQLPAGPVQIIEEMGNFEVAERLYRCCNVLLDRIEARNSDWTRRFVALSIDKDGNRLRNRGLHFAAMQRYVAAMQEWQDIVTWFEPRRNQFTDQQRRAQQASYYRNEGRLRRQLSFMAQALGPKPRNRRGIRTGRQPARFCNHASTARQVRLAPSCNWPRWGAVVGRTSWWSSVCG